jgi:hypothetical protein
MCFSYIEPLMKIHGTVDLVVPLSKLGLLIVDLSPELNRFP